MLEEPTFDPRVWPVPPQKVEGTRGGLPALIEFALFRGVLTLGSRMPAFVRGPLVEGLARIAKVLDRRHASSAREFLAAAFPGEDERALEARVLQAYRHLLGMTLRSQRWGPRTRRWAHGDPSWRDHVDVELSPEVRDVLARDGGMIVVGAHVGDWETGASLLPVLGFGPPTYVVGRPPRNLPLSRYLQLERERRGILLLPRRGAMEFAEPIFRAGGTLVLLLDQRARKRPIYAPLFGRRARCDRSAGVLLRRFRVPIVFAACYETSDPDRLRFVARRRLEPEDLRGRSPEAVASLLNRELEVLIREAPDQYFWLHDRYLGGEDAEARNRDGGVTDWPERGSAEAPAPDRAAGPRPSPADLA